MVLSRMERCAIHSLFFFAKAMPIKDRNNADTSLTDNELKNSREKRCNRLGKEMLYYFKSLMATSIHALSMPINSRQRRMGQSQGIGWLRKNASHLKISLDHFYPFNFYDTE